MQGCGGNPPTACSIVTTMQAALHRLGSSFPMHQSKTPSSPFSTPASRLSVKLRPLTRSRLVTTQVMDVAEQAERAFPKPTLTGTWKKDRSASDSMQEACDMVALPWVLRQALSVLNTLKLEETDSHFVTCMKAGGLLDVLERYPWSGEEVVHPRRDKRRGVHRGRVTRNEEGHPVIEVEFDDPYGGIGRDMFILHQDGHTLEQVTEMKIKATGQETRYKTVFRRERL